MVRLADMTNNPDLENRVWDAFDAYWCTPDDPDFDDYDDEQDDFDEWDEHDERCDFERDMDAAFDAFGYDPLFDNDDY